MRVAPEVVPGGAAGFCTATLPIWQDIGGDLLVVDLRPDGRSEGIAHYSAEQGDDSHGWFALPIREAHRQAVALKEHGNADPERRFVVDFRPHSHHWQAMAAVRGADHEAAILTVGGADIMMAMTSIGDGFFPVHLDVDAVGAPVAIDIVIQD